jgi:hypothetical protein
MTTDNLANLLSRKQTITSIIYGAVLWFIAAMLIQVIGVRITTDLTALIATYVLVIPGTIPALLLGKAVMRLEKRQLPTSVAIITATALLLDGIAVNFARSLYNPDPTAVLTGAAVILWGAGVGLVLSFAMSRD